MPFYNLKGYKEKGEGERDRRRATYQNHRCTVGNNEAEHDTKNDRRSWHGGKAVGGAADCGSKIGAGEGKGGDEGEERKNSRTKYTQTNDVATAAISDDDDDDYAGEGPSSASSFALSCKPCFA